MLIVTHQQAKWHTQAPWQFQGWPSKTKKWAVAQFLEIPPLLPNSWNNPPHSLAYENCPVYNSLGASLVAQLVKNSNVMQETALSIGDPGLIPGSGRSLGESNGNPLQYSCLENPMDREAWQAMVHRFAKRWIQLKWLSMHMFKSTGFHRGIRIETKFKSIKEWMKDKKIEYFFKKNI